MSENLIKFPNAEYVMPFLFSNDLFLPVINELIGENKQHAIKYIYGSINTEWTNGRISKFDLKKEKLYIVDKYLQRLQKYNITAAFTFSNIIHDKKQLKDKLCNELLDIAQKYKSHYIVADEILYKHIKSRYKNAKMVCSVIQPSIKQIEDIYFDETKFYNQMLDKYEIVVLRPEYTIDNIDKLPKLLNDISRVEVLINQRCKYNCKQSKRHYELVYKFNNKKITSEDFYKQVKSFCPIIVTPESKSVELKTENVKKLVDMGITKLKIQGRDKEFNEILEDLYTYYFNDSVTKEELNDRITKICAQIIQKHKGAAMYLV